MHIAPAPCVFAVSEDGRTVLLDTRHSRYYGLNTLGRAVWLRISGGDSLEGLAEEIAMRHDLAVDRVAQDIQTFVDLLARRGLVQRADS